MSQKVPHDSDQPRHPPCLIILRCPQEESLGPKLPIKRIMKTLIRLGRCPGWSESSLGIHSFCWFCRVAAHFSLLIQWLVSVKTYTEIMPLCLFCKLKQQYSFFFFFFFFFFFSFQLRIVCRSLCYDTKWNSNYIHMTTYLPAVMKHFSNTTCAQNYSWNYQTTVVQKCWFSAGSKLCHDRQSTKMIWRYRVRASKQQLVFFQGLWQSTA